MRVLVAGATGAIGAPILELLKLGGHVPIGTSRSESKVKQLRSADIEAVAMDPLNPASVRAAVESVEPEAIINQLTALADATDLRHFDKAFAKTNELRTTGTRNLVEAAKAAGVQRIVSQSFGGWIYEPTGSPATEADPLVTNPPDSGQTLKAIKESEQVVTTTPGIDGVALRYGFFYGPGTNLAPGGQIAELVKKRRFPIVGDGAGVWSLVHINDAASASIAALNGPTGVFNLADDDPQAVRVWLPVLCESMGAKPPRKVPVFLAKLLAGPRTASMMVSNSGMSSEAFKQSFDWAPQWSSWRQGFSDTFG